MEMEMEHACSRRSVPSKFRGRASTAIQCLSKKEKKRWTNYNSMYPGETGDVGQDPLHRPLHSRNGILNTLIRNNHYMMIPRGHGERSNTWLLPSELWTSMGFPISMSCQQATGVQCVFSCGFQNVPCTRTGKSQRNQMGNAMHVNSIGKVKLAVLLKLGVALERLGKRVAAKRVAEGSDTVKGKCAISQVGTAMGEFERIMNEELNKARCKRRRTCQI
eukprot:11201207-Karenia_brevis.AAC.1